MENNKKHMKNLTLQNKAKELISKSKKLGLIKPHTEAFKEVLVEQEEHKGKKTSFCRKGK